MSERFHRVREVDWATLFQRLTFRCRCRSLADALRVERLTEAGMEEVLHVWVRTDYHG